MINKKLITQIISFIVFVLIQILLLRHMVLFDTAFCFLYVAFLILLPVEIGIIPLCLLGFITGFTIDIFYDSLGIHAAACVFIMFVRNYWLNMLTPQGGYDSNSVPSVQLSGWRWFAIYSLPIILVHHLILFFVEAWGFGLFGFTLWKAVLSTVFTFVILIITQFLFYTSRRR